MEKISVAIRVRPLSKQEEAKGSPWRLGPNSITFSPGSGPSSLTSQAFVFDQVFGPDSPTSYIYDQAAKHIIASTVQGFNGTIFAYGQTSSGKTYTMRGSPQEPGIIPLAVHDVFINTDQATDREFLIRVSYMEIYNEEINDLLAPENQKLQVHENLERGIFVAGLREEIVSTPNQVLELLSFGEAHRRVGETNMNVYSSRSHTIFRMVIESRDMTDSGSSDAVRVSVLNLVDLAGSERVSKTGAEGARLKEGTHINKSLMTLGNVINKLSDGIQRQGGHVPYRDSKLTRILQPALGGNAKTTIICNITPALVHSDESKGTLQFAGRANRVTNCAQVNEVMTDAALLKRQKKEIEDLRSKLQAKESQPDYLEEEILILRNKLLKFELERERLSLELIEEKKAQAECERRIKEQEQKIEKLGTMVINCAVDDRDYTKKGNRRERRETWCPRVPSVAAETKDFKWQFQTELIDVDGLLHPIRDRGHPLPPPFEMLLEDEEECLVWDCKIEEMAESADQEWDRSLDSSHVEQKKKSMPTCGAETELQQKTENQNGDRLFVRGTQVNLMQEMDEMKSELYQVQMVGDKCGQVDNRKLSSDIPGRRVKSLDGGDTDGPASSIKFLHAQVERLETEKFFMQRELDRLMEQAKGQTTTAQEDLKELYQELKETTEQLNSVLEQNNQLQEELNRLKTAAITSCEEHEVNTAAGVVQEKEGEGRTVAFEPERHDVVYNSTASEVAELETCSGTAEQTLQPEQFGLSEANLLSGDMLILHAGAASPDTGKAEFLPEDMQELNRDHTRQLVLESDLVIFSDMGCVKASQTEAQDKDTAKVPAEEERRAAESWNSQFSQYNPRLSELESLLADREKQCKILDEAVKGLEREKASREMESSQAQADALALRKELSSLKVVPMFLEKERDALRKESEKLRMKLKETESKLKSTLQDKSRLEADKANMERELKQLRGSTLLQRGINKRESLAEKRRESTAPAISKAKQQLSTLEQTLQTRSMELEKAAFDIQILQESCSKLEFSVVEAENLESSLKEQLSAAEDVIVNLRSENSEKDAEAQRLTVELEVASEQWKASILEKETLQQQSASLVASLQEQEVLSRTAIAELSKEKEELAQQLTDAYIEFEEDKAAFATKMRDQCAEVSADANQKFTSLSCKINELEMNLEKIVLAQEEANLVATEIDKDMREFQLLLQDNLWLPTTQLVEEVKIFSRQLQDFRKFLEQLVANATMDQETRSAQLDQINQFLLTLLQCMEKFEHSHERSAAVLSSTVDRVDLEYGAAVHMLSGYALESESLLSQFVESSRRTDGDPESTTVTITSKEGPDSFVIRQDAEKNCIDTLQAEVAHSPSSMSNTPGHRRRVSASRIYEVCEEEYQKGESNTLDELSGHPDPIFRLVGKRPALTDHEQHISAPCLNIESEIQLLRQENLHMFTSNMKLQVGIQSSKEREEVYRGRLQEALLANNELARCGELPRVGIQKNDENIPCNVVEFDHVRGELASSRLEIVELEVELEDTRVQCRTKLQELRQQLERSAQDVERDARILEIEHENVVLKHRLKVAEDRAKTRRDIIRKLREGAKANDSLSQQASFKELIFQKAMLEEQVGGLKTELLFLHNQVRRHANSSIKHGATQT